MNKKSKYGKSSVLLFLAITVVLCLLILAYSLHKTKKLQQNTRTAELATQIPDESVNKLRNKAYKDEQQRLLSIGIYMEFFLLLLIGGILVLWKKEQLEHERLIQALNIRNQYLSSYETALEQHVLLTRSDVDGLFTYANDNFCRTFHYDKSELLGKDHSIVNSNYHPKTFFVELWTTITSGKAWHGLIRDKTKQGEFVWLDTTITPILDKNGQLIEFISIKHNVTADMKTLQESERLIKRLDKLSKEDELTGISNRRAFDSILHKHLSLARRSKQSFAIAYVDIDHFKKINDKYGHPFGDELLKYVVETVKKTLRDADYFARLGGDEFAILFTNIEGPTVIKPILDRLYKHFSVPFTLNGLVATVQLSIGVSVFPNDGDDVNSLVKKADIALYEAKSTGRNQVCFF